jgi:hypothetical protein
MTTKHTPGPWGHTVDGGIYEESKFCEKIGHIEDRHWIGQIEGRKKDKTVGKDGFNWVGKGETLANARLIAAAPEMLAALQGICKAADEGNCVTLGDVRNAIKKATEGL